jgi:hypothetical protein
MKILLVVAAVSAFAALVAGARATEDRPSMLLCVSAQTYEEGRLSAVQQDGTSCP